VSRPRFVESGAPAGIEPVDSVRWGTVTLTENRATGTGEVALAVAIVSGGPDAPADPMVYVEGGPGFSSLASVERRAKLVATTGRDVVFFDQRGTGASRPSLSCPEITALDSALLDHRPGAPDTKAAYRRATTDAFQRLRDEGIDLTAHHTAELVADLDDIRVALGVDRWNVEAIGHGARVALKYAEAHPRETRTLVLDSPVPPQVDEYVAYIPNAVRAADAVFEAASRDPACADRFPNLAQTFDRVVKELAREPVLVPLPSDARPAAGMMIDGDVVVRSLVGATMEAELIPLIPWLTYEAAAGHFDLLASYWATRLPDPATFSEGLALCVHCHDQAPFTDRAALADVMRRWPAYRVHAYQRNKLDFVDIWRCGRADPSVRTPVRSDVPTLVLRGQFDPACPPEWASLICSTLRHAQSVEIPGVGHQVCRDSSCARELRGAFLEAPTSPLAAGCLAEARPVAFVVP
jgi:pimeloyl-ACP methyl ester carboxylesterase